MASQFSKKIKQNLKMTVRNKSVDNSIEQSGNRDILFKLLCQTPNRKSRQEAVYSYPSHISRKLLLEEHKLSKQLERIEKERKQFLNRNSSEKYLLKLETRKNSRRCLAMNQNHGNGILKKSWTSMSSGVVYQSGAKNIRQLQVKKVCLLKKMAERNCTENTLPWERSFDTPEVPPPSRSPSRTNIIWVRVRNSSGNMEVDGFVRTRKDFEEVFRGDKDEKYSTKIEVRVPHMKDGEDNGIIKNSNTLKVKVKVDGSNFNTDTALTEPYDGMLENQDIKYEASMVKQQCPQTNLNTTQAAHSHAELLTEQLTPMVKGLKVRPNEIRRSISAKQNWEGQAKTAVCENFSKTENNKLRSKNIKNNYAFKEKIKTTTSDMKAQIDLKAEGDLKDDLSNVKSSQTDSESDIHCDQSNVASSQEKVGSVRKKSRNIRKSNRSRSGRKSIETIVRGKGGDDRTKIETNRSEQNITSDEKSTKAKKIKRHGQTSRHTGRSYSDKIKEGRNVQAFGPSKPNVQGICILTKTCKTTESKGKMRKKMEESKTFLPAKLRSTMRLDDRKSAIKLARKSCSACSVKTSAKNGEEIGSSSNLVPGVVRSDTAACSNVRAALVLQQEGSKVLRPEKKSHSPVSISIPSQIQLQNFDKVAKIKLGKALAVKMRKHYYTGTWAFPLPQGRELKEATWTQ